MNKKIKINDHATLFINDRTGIAWIEDRRTGSGYSAHPNIDASGSVRGMKNLGYWGEKDRCVKCCGFIYNIDKLVITHEYDQIAADNCKCGGKH